MPSHLCVKFLWRKIQYTSVLLVYDLAFNSSILIERDGSNVNSKNNLLNCIQLKSIQAYKTRVFTHLKCPRTSGQTNDESLNNSTTITLNDMMTLYTKSHALIGYCISPLLPYLSHQSRFFFACTIPCTSAVLCCRPVSLAFSLGWIVGN